MSSGAINLWFLGLMNNVARAPMAESCFVTYDTPGVCTPIYACQSVLRDYSQLRAPVYCTRDSVIPFVCCPTKFQGGNRNPSFPSTPKFDPFPTRSPVKIIPVPPHLELPPFPTLPPSYTEPTEPTDPPPPPTLPPLPQPTRSVKYPPDQPSEPESPDRIVFHRLADRKCVEYSDYIYENRSTLHLDSSTTIERVNTCFHAFEPALVGGTKAPAKEYPHMALIGYGPDQESVKWGCGGSIISLRFILTAAHCIQTQVGSPTFVRIGDLNHKSNDDDAAPQTIPVLRSIAHENYRTRYVYNDIGLLELGKNIQVTQYARPACLQTDDPVIYPEEEPLIATGWGRTDVHGPSSAELLEVELQHFSTGECQNAYKPSEQLPEGVKSDSQLCAGSRTEKKDTCKGDSGGPLQVKQEMCMYKIVGVTSFGRGCGNIGVPGVYTRVSHFVEWIEERAFSSG